MKYLVALLAFPILTTVFAHTNNQQHILQIKNEQPIVKSVAIIGGGASGTSAAFFLSNVFPPSSSNENIQVKSTIFEKASYIGGRSITVPIKGNSSLGNIELGASIFVEINKHLVRATEKFGLNKTSLSSGLDNVKNTDATKGRPGFGVWDGKDFLFEEKGSMWDNVKLIWRYGLSPLKFQKEQKKTIDSFMNIYNVEGFEDINKVVVDTLDYERLINMTAEEYLIKEMGINEKFAHELLQSATRGNYCQDLNVLHALAVMVSMEASHGTCAVETGNYNIFEEFASRSQATIQLETKVTTIYNITEVDTFGNTVDRYVVETEDGDTQVFDDVILATPLKYSGIQFPPSFSTQEHEREYHVVHVTLVAGHQDPNYFKKTDKDLPLFVVTTGAPLVDEFENHTAPFNTLSVHRILDNGESVTKIFSPNELTEEFLDTLYLNRSWTYHKAWHAFPKLRPITGDSKEHPFPPFVLKANENDESGIIYPAAFENFISTMETQTISGKNAARLLYDKWCNTKHMGSEGINKNCQDFGDGWGTY